MDGERKKRKLDVQEEEEESEEAKMEKFYELIRCSKDIRARLMVMNGERVKEEVKKKKANESKRVGAWNPTFQPEDFMEDGIRVIRCLSRTNNQTGPSNSKREDDRGREEGDDKGGGDDGLDLKLSL